MSVGSITLIFILIQLVLISQRRLLPGVMLLFAFILLVLYITGIIETAIQLFGAGNVSDNCQRYVTNNQITGVQVNTLAWLEQNNICEYLPYNERYGAVADCKQAIAGMPPSVSG